MVLRAQVGPSPCPVKKLTAPLLAARFRVLASEEMARRARAMAASMAAEDGVGTAVAHVERWLPRQNLLCDVSLLLQPPEHRIARFDLPDWLGRARLKVSSEVVAICLAPRFAELDADNAERVMAANALRHSSTEWGLARVSGVLSGVMHGVVGLLLEVFSLFWIAGRQWAVLVRTQGWLKGLAYGLFVMVPLVVVQQALRGCLVFSDRLATGVYNQYAQLRCAPLPACGFGEERGQGGSVRVPCDRRVRPVCATQARALRPACDG
jgi:hypothetical protein